MPKQHIDHAFVQSINHTMDEIHSCVSGIYESLIDRDREELKNQIQSLDFHLKSILDSIEDEA